jgi:D-aminopeptidase
MDKKTVRGKKNSLTDVPGVKVSHLTVHEDAVDVSGTPVVTRTGLTAVLPYAMEKAMRLFAGAAVLSGKGDVTGYEVLEDFRYLNSPIVIANACNVGPVYDAILSYGFILKRDEVWPPLVIGVDDSYLNDMTHRRFKEQEILTVFRDASEGPIPEGAVGAGYGLRALGGKGGIGSSSRVLDLAGREFVLGVLAASNHNNGDLTSGGDSLTLIVGTDLPVLPHQIQRIANSLAAAGSSWTAPGGTDTVSCLLFSTANPMVLENEGPRVFSYTMIDDSFLGPTIEAGVEAAGEAVLNSLVKASPVQGKLGRVLRPIPDREAAKIKQRTS